MIDPVTSLASGSATDPTSDPAAAAKSALSNQQIDKQQFLLLFIEQLKHQDPLSPLEPNELTAQLAQFSSLEQLTGINDRLDKLSDATKEQTGSGLLGLLGKQVRFEGDRISLAGGEASDAGYTLDAAAAEVTVTIRDANGSPVRVINLGAQQAGAQTFHFDGKSANGATLADGTYRIEVKARASADAEPLTVPLTITGVVDGVDLSSDTPTLSVNGQQVTFDRVREVRPAESQDDA